jgi:putative ABC transport system substrate-binding protein
MRRREFIGGLVGVSAIAQPMAAQTQDVRRAFRLGLLVSFPRDHSILRPLFEELSALGYIEGRNLNIEFRELGDDPHGFVRKASELVASNVDAILVEGPGEAPLQATLAATKSIPIVMVAINFDPLARSLISSLARPGGNLTGVAARLPDVAAKQIELLKEGFPNLTELVLLWDQFSAAQFDAAEQAARNQGITTTKLKLQSLPYDFDATFRSISVSGSHPVLVLSSAYFARQRPEIGRAALHHGIPTMFTHRGYVEAGGLMSYGPNIDQMFRRSISYVDKILRGAEPGSLPIEEPSKFEFLLNMKTATAIGLNLPLPLLARADEVIE